MAVRVSRSAALASTGCARLADILAARQFDSAEALVAAARALWWGGHDGDGDDAADDHDETVLPVVGVPDWLAAFASHPRIGNKGDLQKASEREKEASEGGSSGGNDSKSMSHAAAAAAEQAGAASAGQHTLDELARWNLLYERRFGHIFIVCASGRSGEEMLADLKRRYRNPPYAELAIAAEEHIRIAEKRLRGLLSRESSSGEREKGLSPAAAAALRTGALASHLGAGAAAGAANAAAATTTRPPITTHVLDTSLGDPASGVRVSLLSRPQGAPASARAWIPAPGSNSAATAKTDTDGRCSTLLLPGAPRPPPGHYRLEFDVGEYFERTARGVPGYGGGGVARGGSERGGGGAAFYPSAAVEFFISPSPAPPGNGNIISRPEHLHIPLTFSPFGYSTYRGS